MADFDSLTVAELARRFRVNSRTIQREIIRGKIPAIKIGRSYRVKKSDFDLYLKTHLTGQTDEMAKFIEEKKSEMVALLQKLVSMPSETDSADNESRLAHYLKKILDDFGIRCVLVGNGDKIAAHATFGFAEEGILLDCPLDTTHAGDLTKWKYPPFEGAIHAGRMFGRGVADCKAGIVAMIYTLLALKNFVNEELIRVEMVFDGGEQSGGYYGLREVLRRDLPVKTGIIGYAGDEETIGIGCRGYHRYTFTVHGEASHTGSRFRLGVNAITNMAKFMLELEKLKLPGRNLLGFTGNRITFSMINGGREINIVPDECVARVDIRTLPNQNRAMLDEYIAKVVGKMVKSDPKFKLDIKYDLGQEGYMLQKNEPILRALQGGIKSVYEKEFEPIAQGPSHVGTLLNEHHIPMVVFGPRGGNVHSYDEYVEISSLTKTTQVYSETVLNYFNLR